MTQLLKIQSAGTSVVLSKRAQNRVDKRTHYAAGRFWDRRYLRLHFLKSAGVRYNYQNRSKKTSERKKQLAKRGIVKKGGVVDMVHSGLLETTMKHQHVIRATPTRVTIPMPATSYVSTRPRGGKINMAAELLRVIPSETTEINKEAQREHDAATQYEAANNRYSVKT